MFSIQLFHKSQINYNLNMAGFLSMNIAIRMCGEHQGPLVIEIQKIPDGNLFIISEYLKHFAYLAMIFEKKCCFD